MAAYLCQLALIVLPLSALCYGKRLQSASAPATVEAGAPGGAPGAAPSASPAAAPAVVDPCSCHFDDYCTCGATMQYLQCVQNTCKKEGCKCDMEQFSSSCGKMASVCKETLDVTCSEKEAQCEGKFHQGTDSLIGLTIDYDKLESKAYCGPFGKCVGEVNVAVKVHKPAAGVRLECAMEKRPGNELVMIQKGHVGTRLRLGLGLNSSKLEGCAAKVESDEAGCTMPMPKELPSGESIEGACQLVEDATGRILTKGAWFSIKNPAKNREVEPEVEKPKPPPAKGSAEPLFRCAAQFAIAAALTSTLFAW